MKPQLVWLPVFLLVPFVANAQNDIDRIPDISAFLMPEAKETALARSAAPAKVSDNATILVLRNEGYETAIEGTNGFFCRVVRSWGGPMYTEKASGLYDPEAKVPECLDARAVEVIWPFQVFRTELALQRTPPKETVRILKGAFKTGRFQRTRDVSVSYMMSNEMMLAAGFPGPPHVMIYLPDDYTREMSGNLSWGDQVLYHEGGPEQPYTALMIMREGIDPIHED